MVRVVIDANVLVSGILTRGGPPGKILEAWRGDRFHLVTSKPILGEIARVLRYPKIASRHGWPEKEIAAFSDDLAHLSVLTVGKLTLTAIQPDPADNRYLECAVEGEADYIVSGDRHLLGLERFRDVEIVTPRAFLELLE